MRFVILYSTLHLLLLFFNCKGCLEEEREALLQIKTSMNIPDDSAFSNWYGQDCCRWQGVDCDGLTFSVVRIVFPYIRSEQSSNSWYPKSEQSSNPWYPNATLFAQFKYLQELRLPGNNMAGFISPNALHKLQYLQSLYLLDNSIADGSHLCWGNMPNLKGLDLSWNLLKGDIPKCICQNHYYTRVSLSFNRLNGSLDACFGNMTSLKHLFLAGNDFNGSFPSLFFKNLTNLESFAISNNQFKDVISFSIFGNLSKLSSLDISFNDELQVETESPTWSPSFRLNELKLAACNLNSISGRIVPSFISTQHNLQLLDLSYNALVGGIPSWLFCNASSELWIRGNNFTGVFPRTKGNISSRLTVLDISDNGIQGPLPKDINFLFPMLSHLNASVNRFTGNIPESLGELKQLVLLDLSTNNLIGEISRGVVGNLTYLEYLKLSKNKLQGEPLPRNSSLPSLRWLFLDRNGFSGSLLDSLSTCSSTLIYLCIHYNDLSGELSTNLPFFPKLRLLILRGNCFQGEIPLQVCQMQHLHVLDLSLNEVSGAIPSCLDNITHLITRDFNAIYFESSPWFAVDIFNKHWHLYYPTRFLNYLHGIDLSYNNLTGTIPSQLMKLTELVVLNLSNNLLTGQLPATLSDLQNLESLDLSKNKLIGSFPENITNLLFLAVFDVSYNNLSGPIPQGKQFSTFSPSSYWGNQGLCGRPLEKKCEELGEKNQGETNKKPDLYSNVAFILIYIVVNVFHCFVDIV